MHNRRPSSNLGEGSNQGRGIQSCPPDSKYLFSTEALGPTGTGTVLLSSRCLYGSPVRTVG
jgi:hypothetical protein